MEQAITPTNNELIKIVENNGKRAVNARELHQFLESKQDFSTWIKSRIEKYDFVENQDYQTAPQIYGTANGGHATRTEYALSIDMAKELSMVENNEKGKLARRYFIECEKMVAERQAAQLPNTYLEALKALVASEERKQVLELENKAMKPKADYFDDLVERNMLTGIRDTAKELGWKQNAFIARLIADGYLYRNNNKSLRPVAEYANDLFVLKDSKSSKTQWAGVQTMITPKGKETFRLLYMGKAEE